MTDGVEATDLAAIRALIERSRFDEAHARCRPIADSGSVVAQLYLGWMYQTGKGVDKDLDQAENWYRQAIAGDPARGEFYLATVRRDRGDQKQAREWFERSAARGYAPAMYQLGRIYRCGYGVTVDRQKAFEYIERAAAKGHLFARRDIARNLLRGQSGIHRVPAGLFALIGVAWQVFKVARRDPYDDRMLHC